MKEEKIKKIAGEEVKKIKRLLTLGAIDRNLVTFDLFMEGVIEDFNIPKDQHELLESELRNAMKVHNLKLLENN
ncbi:hypothetical protein V6R21_15165 [Limibacter armeniacum]|uniref:hypothetical protein n=1 Tax=Limibacter armeniacum TaxID=466084 RepID=UPI002FE59FB9